MSLEINKDYKKKWLITGVAGFIGSNLLEELLLRDQTVFGIDNFSTGSQDNLDFVKNAEWGIKTKILDVEFIDSVNFDLDVLNSAINQSGYETMNTTADQKAYDGLPMCCKYDRNMVVYGSKSE